MIRVGFRLDFIFIFIRLYVYQCTWIEWMLPLLIAWTAEHYVACSLRAINFLWNVIKHSMKVRACLDDKTRNCLIGGRIKMVVKLQCISNFVLLLIKAPFRHPFSLALWLTRRVSRGRRCARTVGERVSSTTTGWWPLTSWRSSSASKVFLSASSRSLSCCTNRPWSRANGHAWLPRSPWSNRARWNRRQRTTPKIQTSH